MFGWGVVALVLAGAYLVGLTLWSVLVVAAVAEDEREGRSHGPGPRLPDDDDDDDDDSDDDDSGSGGGPVAGRVCSRAADRDQRTDRLSRASRGSPVRRPAGLRVRRVAGDRSASALAAAASRGRNAGDPVPWMWP